MSFNQQPAQVLTFQVEVTDPCIGSIQAPVDFIDYFEYAIGGSELQISVTNMLFASSSDLCGPVAKSTAVSGATEALLHSEV